MYNWFYDPDNHFYMWGTAHLMTIGVALLCFMGLFIFRRTLEPYKRSIRLTVGWALIVSRISLDVWYIQTEQWSITSSLPFELCSIASILCGIMLLTKSKILFDIFYFIAIGGAIQAILTPELLLGFPQYRYIQFFLDHTLLILSPLIMITLYHFRPTFWSVFKSFIGLNVIAVIVYMINRLIDANYMFLIHKPSTPSVIDYLGPYPFYIMSLELVALIIFILLYIPFVVWPRQENRF